MIDLKVSREHIDAIDKQIVELFEKRMIESSEVAKYKLETGKPVYDKEREEDKLKNLKSMSSNEFNQRAITVSFPVGNTPSMGNIPMLALRQRS